MILTKEEFVSVIDDMRNAEDFNVCFNKIVDKHGGYSDTWFPSCTVSLLKLLQKMFNDTNDWIGYFCTDKDYGRKDLYCSKKLDTAEDLYDLLIEYMNK